MSLNKFEERHMIRENKAIYSPICNGMIISCGLQLESFPSSLVEVSMDHCYNVNSISQSNYISINIAEGQACYILFRFFFLNPRFKKMQRRKGVKLKELTSTVT